MCAELKACGTKLIEVDHRSDVMIYLILHSIEFHILRTYLADTVIMLYIPIFWTVFMYLYFLIVWLIVINAFYQTVLPFPPWGPEWKQDAWWLLISFMFKGCFKIVK